MQSTKSRTVSKFLTSIITHSFAHFSPTRSPLLVRVLSRCTSFAFFNGLQNAFFGFAFRELSTYFSSLFIYSSSSWFFHVSRPFTGIFGYYLHYQQVSQMHLLLSVDIVYRRIWHFRLVWFVSSILNSPISIWFLKEGSETLNFSKTSTTDLIDGLLYNV